MENVYIRALTSDFLINLFFIDVVVVFRNMAWQLVAHQLIVSDQTNAIFSSRENKTVHTGAKCKTI